jgi:hypothetical protein
MRPVSGFLSPVFAIPRRWEVAPTESAALFSEAIGGLVTGLDGALKGSDPLTNNLSAD